MLSLNVLSVCVCEASGFYGKSVSHHCLFCACQTWLGCVCESEGLSVWCRVLGGEQSSGTAGCSRCLWAAVAWIVDGVLLWFRLVYTLLSSILL